MKIVKNKVGIALGGGKAFGIPIAAIVTVVLGSFYLAFYAGQKSKK